MKNPVSLLRSVLPNGKFYYYKGVPLCESCLLNPSDGDDLDRIPRGAVQDKSKQAACSECGAMRSE